MMCLQMHITYYTRTYLFIAMLGFQIAIFLDLYLVLRDPFSPRERRMKWFYAIPFSLLIYILNSDEKSTGENLEVRLNLIYVSTGVTLWLMVLIIQKLYFSK